MSIDFAGCLDQARKLAMAAKDGTLKVGADTYTLTFDHREWHYLVHNAAGVEVVRFNTKKLAQARQWLREWLAN
jgi:hypothetical protein